MKADFYTKIVLTVIAIALTANLLKDVDFVTKAQAGTSEISQSNPRVERVTEEYADSYAKNKYAVYFNGEMISGARPDYFVVLTDGYSKDDKKAYYRGNPICDSYRFEAFTRGYAKKSDKIYYKGRIKDGISAKEFVVLN